MEKVVQFCWMGRWIQVSFEAEKLDIRPCLHCWDKRQNKKNTLQLYTAEKKKMPVLYRDVLSKLATWNCLEWHRTGYSWWPVQTLPVTPLWCDLGRCSQTVVVTKLLLTSALALFSNDSLLLELFNCCLCLFWHCFMHVWVLLCILLFFKFSNFIMSTAAIGYFLRMRLPTTRSYSKFQLLQHLASFLGCPLP